MFASLRIATLACLGLSFGLVASPRHARAEGSLPGGATVVFDGPFIYENDSDDDKPTRGDAEKIKDYFNAAHCECANGATASEYKEKTFAWQLSLNGRSQQISRPGDIWVGSQCSTNDGTTREQNCTQVDTVQDIDTLSTGTNYRNISLFDLMAPDPQDTVCPARAGETTTWILVDTNGDGTYDYDVSKVQAFDAQPPAQPSEVEGKPGEGAVVMSWTNPTERPADTKYYYFLCALNGEPALAKPSETAEFETPKSLCNLDKTIEFGSADGTGTQPAWLSEDITRYVCGRSGGTSTSARIGGLQAGLAYEVAMIAVDEAGNAIGQYLPNTVTPTSVIDFWEDLHDRGSDTEGGFCIAGFTFGDDSGMSQQLRAFRDDTLGRSSAGRWLTARYYEVSSWLAPWAGSWALRAVAAVVLTPLAVLALAWHFLTLPGALALLVLGVVGWRKRSAIAARLRGRMHDRMHSKLARVGVAAATLLVVLGWAGVSSAQSSLDPYWDEDNAGFSDDSYEVNWHAGIKLGPYTPAIDAQLGGSGEGPYEAMFGGYAIVPMLDVDYIFMQTELGQIGFGGSIGFLNKKASAFAMGSTPGPDRPRTAEHNRFRMIPMAATAVFRLTYLDDKFHIPIIPYARGGLAYHVWWAEAPDGGVSSVCREGGATCDENKGRGGSLGVVGSLGIAVRAENIDFEAASAMREGGIQHAGFYAEVQSSKVDDFGVGNKLAVGDSLTWFAGVDFEF